MKPLITLVSFLLLLLPSTVLAELPEQVERDFNVVRGVIVMQAGEEYLVDLDASDALQEGDILTLVTAGEKIVHPQTKQTLGTVDVPVGFLQVTRIKSGYSYATLLSADAPPQDGTEVRRFEQVPARFVDPQGDGDALANQLKINLPQITWLAEQSPVEPLLTFTLKGNTLTVDAVGDVLLHTYSVTADQQLYAPDAPARRSSFGSRAERDKMLLEQVADVLMSPFEAEKQFAYEQGAAVIRQGGVQQKGVWMSPNIPGEPVGLAVADLNNDGLQETAVAMANQVVISQIKQGEYTNQVEVSIPLRLQVLSLDSIDLDRNGVPELYLTAAADNYQLASLVIEYIDGAYQVVIDEIRWYLRVVELPGKEQTLIGQAFGNYQQSFIGQPFYVRREGDRLIKGDAINLPKLVNIYSFVPFKDHANTLHYAYLTMDDHLKVVSATGAELWESEDYYGGSEACFSNRKETIGEMVTPTCLPPRMITTPSNEILVVQNDGQRLMQRYRKFKKSRLLAVRWNRFVLEERWRTASQQGYLGDYALADADNDGEQELVMAVKFKHKGLIDDARSAIVIID